MTRAELRAERIRRLRASRGPGIGVYRKPKRAATARLLERLPLEIDAIRAGRGRSRQP